MVVVGRQPLGRLVSYFGMAWVGDPRRGNISSWSKLSVWLLHVTGAELSDEIGTLWLPEDEYHTRPLSQWLDQQRIHPSDVIPIKLERMAKDIAKLRRILCVRHAFCGRLPPLPRRRLEGHLRSHDKTAGQAPPLRKLWSDDKVRVAL